MKATKENLIQCLEKIGWSVRDHGCDHLFIYNHKKVNTHWYIYFDRIELDDHVGSFDETPACVFYFKNCYLQWLPSKEKRKTTICLTAKGTNKSVFLFFANYDFEV